MSSIKDLGWKVGVAVAVAAVLATSAIVVRAPVTENEVRNLRSQVDRIETKVDALLLQSKPR